MYRRGSASCHVKKIITQLEGNTASSYQSTLWKWPSFSMRTSPVMPAICTLCFCLVLPLNLLSWQHAIGNQIKNDGKSRAKAPGHTKQNPSRWADKNPTLRHTIKTSHNEQNQTAFSQTTVDAGAHDSNPQSLKLKHLGKKEMFIVIGHWDIVEILLHSFIMAIADSYNAIKPRINSCSVNSHCLSLYGTSSVSSFFHQHECHLPNLTTIAWVPKFTFLCFCS